MANVEELTAHGISVTQRPATPAEAAIVATYVKTIRDSLQARLRSSGREPLILVVVGVVLAPVFLLIPVLPTDGAGLRVVLVALAVFFAGMGAVAYVRQKQRAGQQLADFDVIHPPLAVVDELVFHPKRLLIATDADGEGQEWLLFEVEDGFFVRDNQQAYGQPITDVIWSERVTLVCDAFGSLLTASSDGVPVPCFDGSLRPPDFVVTAQSAFWSPNYDEESESDIVPAAEVWAGTWPEAARNLGSAR